MLNRPAIIALLFVFGWGAASGCVSNTKTGTEPSNDIAQAVDAIVDTQVDANMPDSATDLGPESESDTAGPQDTSPADNFIPPPQDTTPPTWPEGASLQASNIEPTSLTLSWPSAMDDTFVATYVVYRDEVIIENLDGVQTNLKVKHLKEAQTLQFKVVATDEAGNTSPALELTVQTNDKTPPTWPAGANLNVTQVVDTGASLAWTAAQDNVHVMEYRVMAGDTVVHTATEAQAELSALTPWTEYGLHIVAVDGAGNVSKPGPSLTFKTPDTEAPLWAEGAALNIEVLDATSLKIGWLPEVDDAGGLKTYKVFENKVAVGTLDVEEQGNDPHVLAKGLKAQGSYTYTVQAIDVAGNISTNGPTATVNMQDQTAPSWPEGANLLASNITPNTLTLAWTPANDDVSVTAYHVHQDGEEVAVVATTHATIQGLGPWTDYTFTVWAKDGAGNLSKQGPSLSLKTPDSSHPMWLEGASLTASDVTPHSLTLSWQAATDDVTVVHHHVFQDGVKIGTLDGQATTFDVTGLSPWTDYDFAVRAEDQAGNMSEADLSLTVKTTDEVAPSWAAGELVASDITPYALTLTWPEAIDDVGVTAYSVALDGAELINLAGDVTSLEVVDLSPWTEYGFSVTAFDAAGNSSAGGPSLSVKTTDTVKPTWPNDAALVASDVTATSMTLSWPEATDDVEVVAYKVLADDQEVATIQAPSTTANLSGLQSGHYYQLNVHALDAAGNYSASLSTSVQMEDGGPPTWPENTLLTSVAVTEVYLGWEAATDDVGVTGYRIYQDGAPIAETDKTQHLVEGLSPETSYGFKVEARDKAGHWSTNGPSATVTTAKDLYKGFRKLTKDQLINTLADLIGGEHETWLTVVNGEPPSDNTYFGTPAKWRIALTHVQGYWASVRRRYPDDKRTAGPHEERGGFGRLDSVVTESHVAALSGYAMIMGRKYWDTQNLALRFFKYCRKNQPKDIPLPEVYDACVDDWIYNFGLRAWRRPVTQEEHNFLKNVFLDAETAYPDEEFSAYESIYWRQRGIGDLIAAMLHDPQFYYRMELGDENGALTAYELATRLSYHFWNTMPDKELFDAAANGSLMTEDGYKAQVDRLFNDPKSERAIEEFYGDFFRVNHKRSVSRQDSLGGKQLKSYHNLPGQQTYGVTTNSDGMLAAEMTNLGQWFTHTQPGTYEDMFRSNLNFLECKSGSLPGVCWGAGPWSAMIYGMDGCSDSNNCTGGGWDGVSQPETFPEPERAGLLTRMAFLVHNTYQARPIRRGLDIREMLLCDPIPPPENCDVVKPPQVDGDKVYTMTVREKVEEITEQPGTSCAGCHVTFINGFGHALGHFSSRGAYWKKEHMHLVHYNADGSVKQTYNVLADEADWAPIDATGTTLYNGQWVTLNGAHELTDFLVDTGQLEWCWSREYFRFAMGRTEWDGDTDAIEGLAESLRNGSTLADGFKAIAYLPQFKTLFKPPQAVPPGGTP